MNFRTTYILFAILAGLVGLFLLVLVLNPAKPLDTSYLFPSMHDSAKPVQASDIDTVIVQRDRPESKKLVFERDKTTSRWRMVEPQNLPGERVDQAAVDRLVNQIRQAKVEKDTDIQGALKQWELEPPNATVTLKKGDQQWQLFLGKESLVKGSSGVVAVSSSERKESLAARLNSLDTIAKGPYEFRAKETLAENIDEIRKVSLGDGVHTPVILQRVSFGQWKFEQPNYGPAEYEGEAAAAGAAKTITGVKGLLEILTGLKVEVKSNKEHDFVSEDARNLDQYGLSGDKLLRITVTRSVGSAGKENEVTQTLLIGKKPDEKSDKVFAMLEGERHIVKVPAANLDLVAKLLENPGVLRNRDLVSVAESNIDAIAVSAGGSEFELFKTGAAEFSFGPSKWRLFRKDQGSDADAMVIDALIKALTAKRQIKDFPDPAKVDEKAMGLDSPAATVSLWESGIKKEEKKDDKKDGDKKEDEKKKEEEKKDAKPTLKDSTPTVKLLFGKRENGVVYVKRVTKDATTYVTVPESLLDTVSKPALAYLDKKLASFDGDVTQVVLERGGETFKVEKEKDKPTWKITAPKELEGRTANFSTVQGIISSMQFLRADKIVAEKATPEQEEQYGLKTPTTKVTLTVTRDNKTEDWTYLFGKDVDNNVYAKQGNRDMVFQVARTSLTPLQGELRDTTLVTFDRASVQGVKITAWYDLFRQAQTLELERKSATEWAVGKNTSPAAQVPMLDPRKAEDFLNFVMRQKVDKFVGKTGPQPQKMLLTDDAIEIEVTLGGDAKPFKLTVGGETPDQSGWFAKSSALEGEFFILARADKLPKDQTADQFAKIRTQTPAQFFAPPK